MKRLALLTLMSVVGCAHYTALTRDQLAERGTHRYVNTTRAKVMDACASSLATLGYKVTVNQAENGVLKTAPAPIMTSATGGPGYANVTDDGLAWAFIIEQSENDVVVHATPRGFRNGTEMEMEGMWVAEVMDPKFRDLWREIDSTLGVPSAAPK